MLIDVNARDRIDIPHEANLGAWVELRPLRAVEVEEARDRSTDRTLDKFGTAERVGVIKALSTVSADDERETRRRMREDIEIIAAQYDAETMLKYAVVGLSYRDDLRDMSSLTPAERLDILRDLDDTTRKFIHEKAVELNVRPPQNGSDSSPS